MSNVLKLLTKQEAQLMFDELAPNWNNHRVLLKLTKLYHLYDLILTKELQQRLLDGPPKLELTIELLTVSSWSNLLVDQYRDRYEKYMLLCYCFTSNWEQVERFTFTGDSAIDSPLLNYLRWLFTNWLLLCFNIAKDEIISHIEKNCYPKSLI